MKTPTVAIATMTWARNAEEELLLRESLTQLAQHNIPVYLTDGGSGEEFLQFLRTFPHFHLMPRRQPGVYAQIRQSLRGAMESGADFVLYTEPDKKFFFAEKLTSFMAALSEAYKSHREPLGIFLASRDEKSYATFPAFQQYTESVINRLCAELTGVPVDYSYGPFFLSRQVITLLDGLEDDIGWGWRLFSFAAAKRAGYRIDSHVGEFPCPEEQRDDNAGERLYRMRQLQQSIDGLLLSTQVS